MSCVKQDRGTSFEGCSTKMARTFEYLYLNRYLYLYTQDRFPLAVLTLKG